MRCPYCRNLLTETAKECTSCHLSLRSANALLGPIPRYGKGLTDKTGILDKKSAKKIHNALSILSRNFPQVEMHVLLQEFDRRYPVGTHLFWLFNQGSFCASSRKGGKNHSLMLGLAPRQGRIGLIVGYGRAILTVISSLDTLMRGICDSLSETLGIEPPETTHKLEY